MLPSPPPTATFLPEAAVCLAQANPPAERPAPPLAIQVLPLLAIGLAAYMLLFRPERERLRRQQAMLTALKKNDRVVTSSGIYGTVVAVDRDHDRITLRIDESANTKLTVTLASIGRVLGEAGDSSAHSDS